MAIKFGTCPECHLILAGEEIREEKCLIWGRMWGVYARITGKGFKRIGWIYIKCGHCVLDEERAALFIRELA